MPVKELKLLNDAASLGIIDLALIEREVRMRKEEEYLRKHEFKIWEGSNGFFYTYILDGGRRKLLKKKSKRDLEKAIASHYEDEELNFKEAFNEWIAFKEGNKEVKETSIIRYKEDYKRLIEGTSFERMKVSEVDDSALDIFVRGTIAKYGLTSKGYACFRTILIGVLKHAKRLKKTDFSVSTFFKDFEISRSAFKAKPSKRKDVYTKDERKKLYSYLRTSTDISYMALSLMCLTGLRIGELSCLKKEDNVSDCHLYIRRTETKYVKENGKVGVKVGDSPKMDHEEVIVIPRAAQRIIDLAFMQSREDEYLFSKGGKRLTAYYLRRRLKKACEEAGISYKPPHQMRKTFGSILLSEGVDEAIVKREMRHKDISTTRAYYHYITESDDEEKSIIDRVMGL